MLKCCGKLTTFIENDSKKAEWSKKKLNRRFLKAISCKMIEFKKINHQSSNIILIL